MVIGAALQPLQGVAMTNKFSRIDQLKRSEMRSWLRLRSDSLSSIAYRREYWSHDISEKISSPTFYVPCRHRALVHRSLALPVSLQDIPLVKSTSLAFTRSCDTLLANRSTALLLFPAIGVVVFAIWGFVPLMRNIRSWFDHGGNWKKSQTYLISTSYLQPLLLWTGATFICRALDPVVLPSAASEAVKTRLLTFVRSLSTVLAFAYCLTSLIQQTKKFFVQLRGSSDTRNMGFDFALRAVYTGIWIAACSLYMELLGFNTQRWLTAGGFGTVLLTLAGREIFTNFLSSVTINATRPLEVNEWITATIDGVQVSGTVEHVGWWSPTLIRGDDKEAIYVPNHKFTVNVLRNKSRRNHWRIKETIAISHMDLVKINSIVADMRKVLAKLPQIDQQMHRRVFLDRVDSVSQALMVDISCFVKTSHYDEFLCVKEAVLLDLLRIIGHHGARLATPIRTVQKSYGDADMENIPFGEMMYNHARGRPLLIDTSARINDDKSKPRQSLREEQKAKTTASAGTKSTPSESALLNNSEKQEQKKLNSEDGRLKNNKNGHVISTPSASSSQRSESLESVDSASIAGKGKPQVSEPVDRQADGAVSSSNPRKEDKLHGATSTASRRSYEDNIVLGVALEGSKRTLPIEEGMSSGSHRSEPEAEQGKVEAAPSSKESKNQSTTNPGQQKADHRNLER